ncbi:TraK domain-containing protein [Campylobacter sp. MG1]|uniref:TraK domain-containing protein n=1 Tax=Campylobacter sp. MG1 TaxID=2976332 RepID=UPI00226CAE40|nr:type-F conjugative transfer system secretin TraK [Campylobacter sp. MG1]
MKKNLAILSMLISNIAFAQITINDPSDGINISLSNSSVNRIVLPYPIKDVAYSKEKGLIINVNKNQAFIKFIPYQKEVVDSDNSNSNNANVIESKVVYDKAKSSEVFFVTKEKTFSFVFVPKNIKTQTIIINDTNKETNEIISEETANDHSTNIANLVKKVFSAKETPQGYKSININKMVYKDNIKTYYHKNNLQGALYDISVYEILNNTAQSITIEDKDFFNYIGDNPVAIAIYYDNEFNQLLPYAKAKAIIIAKKGGNK